MNESFARRFDVAHTLAPAARTAGGNGSAVDLSGYGGATFVATYGAWTDGTHSLDLEESDDSSTWSDIAAEDLDGAAPVVDGSGDASQSYRIGYLGRKRYVRANNTASGTTTGAVFAVTVIRHAPRVAPK